MVESEAKELTEEIMLGAVMFGHRHFQPVIDAIIQLAEKAAKEPREFAMPDTAALEKEMLGIVEADLRKAYAIPRKAERQDAVAAAKKKAMEHFFPDGTDNPERPMQLVAGVFKELEAKIVRWNILDTRKRIDGRDLVTVRPIVCEAAFLPRTHGSALFTRGETQALVVATLGTGEDEQFIDALQGTYKETFLLHYNFPPFSVGETGRIGAPGRREIGHGKLAWRAIRPMLPSKDEFPYTIRVVSEITESNGSSSMATVCGTSLALMDAGVPLKRAIAGIAMGLIKEEERFAVLSDILGDEDHLGDMDFKVAGTEVGVTSLQMDIKIAGITEEIMKVALTQAKGGRMHILGEMAKALNAARAELGEHAPRIEIVQDPDRQDPRSDRHRRQGDPRDRREDRRQDRHRGRRHRQGRVRRTANRSSAAINWIKSITSEPEVGTIYDGKVVKVDGLRRLRELLRRQGRPGPHQPARAAPRAEGHRRGQGRRHGQGEAPGLRRPRQDPPVDEGRRPGDRRGPRSQAEGRRRAARAAQEAVRRANRRRGRISIVSRTRGGRRGRPFLLPGIERRYGFSRSQKIAAHRADALEVGGAALLELEMVARRGAEALADMDAAGLAVRFHARGKVHRVAPDVVGEARIADDAGGGRAAMDADAHLELAPAERRLAVDRLEHRQREPADRDRALGGAAVEARPPPCSCRRWS